MILTATFKRRLSATAAALLWSLALSLVIFDVLDSSVGVPFRLGIIAAIAASTVSKIAYLEWHLPSVETAFEIGVATGEAKANRENVIQLPRQQQQRQE